MEDLSNYEKLKEDGHGFYSSIGRVFSPFFQREIHFNAEGFNHLVFKRAHSERDRQSQMLRFKLLPLAVKLLKLATTHQEFEETLKEVMLTRFKKKERASKPTFRTSRGQNSSISREGKLLNA